MNRYAHELEVQIEHSVNLYNLKKLVMLCEGDNLPFYSYCTTNHAGVQEEFPSNPIFQMSRPVYDVGVNRLHEGRIRTS